MTVFYEAIVYLPLNQYPKQSMAIKIEVPKKIAYKNPNLMYSIVDKFNVFRNPPYIYSPPQNYSMFFVRLFYL